MLASEATANGDTWLFADIKGRYPASPTDVIPNTRDVDSLSFGPDGSLAVGTSGGVSVYSPANGYSSPPITTGQETAAGSNAQFNASGFLAISNSTGTAAARYANGALTSVLLSPRTQGTVAALSDRNVLAAAEADGLHLYVASKEATAGFIDMVTVPYPGRQAPADVEFSPDGSALVENIDGEVYVYDTSALIGTLHAIGSAAASEQSNMVMGFDPADTAVLATTTPGAVDLIDVSDSKVSVIPGTAGAAWASFAPSGALAVVTSAGVLLFPRPLTAPGYSRIPGTAGAVRVTFSPVGAMAVVGVGPSGLTVYPPGNFSSAAAVTPRVTGAAADGNPGLESVAFGPSGQLAAVVSTSGQQNAGVAVFAPGTYTEQGFIPDSLLASVNDGELIAFAPDGTLAIGNAADIALYAPGTYEKPRIIAGVKSTDDSGYGWVAFSRGGILLSGDSSVGVSLWDDVTGQDLATVSVSTNQDPFGEQLAVSPDGKYFAYESAIGDSDYSDSVVTLIWSAPYLDGDVTDGVHFLCDQLGDAPGPSQWSQYFTSGLTYPGICG
jgi:WD40 repeat protein